MNMNTISGKTSHTKDFKDMTPRMEGEWQEFREGVYGCQVYLFHEPEGDFSVIAASLPGVASQGDTEEEALRNIMDAFAVVFAAYKESGQKIPWLPTPRDAEPGWIERWVIVNA